MTRPADAEVIVVGAGPAGAVAAIVLARAGVRVRLIDRATFPRHKLCGDTLNPGALAVLARLGLATVPEREGVRIDGMRVTGAGGVAVEARYPDGFWGRSIGRAELDWSLVREAVAAGAGFTDGTAVREVIVEDSGSGSRVTGVRVGAGDGLCELRAPVTIAADGRHSSIAFALGLARHPVRPRRWAVGAYAQCVGGMSSFGEMHIRPGRYIGVAPLPGGIANVCLVRPSGASDRDLHDPQSALAAELAADAMLRERFAAARFLARPVVLGPLAVDAVHGARVPDGLLLAGDAAGFIDPMTGDGLRFAIRGAELTAVAALAAIEHGWGGVQASHQAARRREFSAKWRFNRVLRSIVGSPRAVRGATIGARLMPALVRAVILRASDCDVAEYPPASPPRLYGGSYPHGTAPVAGITSVLQ